jgi:ubiquinone/menaquinone biosynthesis C-methylase UbiE
MQSEATGDEALKSEVRDFWNTRPCGTQFTHLPWGTPEFFADVERTRYDSHPFLRRVAEFDQFRGQKVLEIGCGLGTDLIQFARGGAQVTGVDLTDKSIELVRRRFALEQLNVDARVADAEHLPFPDETFDCVYSFGVLHHTPDTQRAIDEAHRVIKPGGRAIIMLYHLSSIRVWVGAPIHGLRSLLSTKHGFGSTVDDWIRVYDGLTNPLGKAYTQKDAERMFARFGERSYEVCHPVRLGAPEVLNSISQRLLAPRFGFFLVIKARK